MTNSICKIWHRRGEATTVRSEGSSVLPGHDLNKDVQKLPRETHTRDQVLTIQFGI